MTHEMGNDETRELAATTVIVGVYIDATLRKARPLPSDVRQHAVLMLQAGSDEPMAG
jgi:acyl-CoA thioesterase FadM